MIKKKPTYWCGVQMPMFESKINLQLNSETTTLQYKTYNVMLKCFNNLI